MFSCGFSDHWGLMFTCKGCVSMHLPFSRGEWVRSCPGPAPRHPGPCPPAQAVRKAPSWLRRCLGRLPLMFCPWHEDLTQVLDLGPGRRAQPDHPWEGLVPKSVSAMLPTTEGQCAHAGQLLKGSRIPGPGHSDHQQPHTELREQAGPACGPSRKAAEPTSGVQDCRKLLQGKLWNCIGFRIFPSGEFLLGG